MHGNTKNRTAILSFNSKSAPKLPKCPLSRDSTALWKKQIIIKNLNNNPRK